MRKKKERKTSVTSNVRSDVTSTNRRKVREGLTRVGIVTSPIKGKNTQAKQQNRWTP